MSITIAILLSGRHGRGSNVQAIVEACASGKIDGAIALVVGNYADSPALERTAALGLKTITVSSPPKNSGDTGQGAYALALQKHLDEVQPDLICLAGYLLKLPEEIVTQYAGRIMNIHNALLPSFGGRGMFGLRVHQAALDYGVKISGCTVHFVDNGYDTGPIILQTPVPVEEGDTAEILAARVLKAEHATFWKAISLFAQGRLSLEGRRVHIREE